MEDLILIGQAALKMALYFFPAILFGIYALAKIYKIEERRGDMKEEKIEHLKQNIRTEQETIKFCHNQIEKSDKYLKELYKELFDLQMEVSNED